MFPASVFSSHPSSPVGGAAVKSAATAAGGSGARAVVLLLEDNETIATLMATVLQERLGVRVIWSATAAGGRREFERHQAEIGIVVADCRLPDGDGRVVAHQLRKIVPDLPVLLTSGRFGCDNYAPLEPGKRVQFLPKPYSPSEIVARVRAMLESRVADRPPEVAGFV
jgi:two-component system cell cycle sensor histidine kinase/response regulator CckA